MENDTKIKALKEILYGAGINFVLGIIGYFLMFLFKLIAARYFGPADLGLYEMLVTIIGVAAVFSSFGLENGIQRFVSEYIERKEDGLLRGYHKFCFGVVVLTSLSIAALLFAFSGTISSFFGFDSHFSLLVKIISVGVILRVLREVTQHFLLAYKKPFLSGMGNHIIEKSMLLVGVIVVVSFDLSLLWMVVFLIISTFLSLVVTAVFYSRIKKPIQKPVYDKKTWIHYSLPLVAMGVVFYLLQWTDNFVIGKMMTPADLGLYSLAYSLASYLIFITTVLGSLFLPAMMPLYLQKDSSFGEAFRHVVKWNLILSVFFGMLFIFFSRSIMVLLFGAQYQGSGMSLTILSIFFVAASIFSFRSHIILIEKDTKFILWNTLLCSLINLFLSILLVRDYGIEGVAFSTGVCFFLLKLNEYLRARRFNRIKEDFVVKFKIIIIGLISIFLVKVFFLFFMNNLSSVQMVIILLASVAYALIFLFILSLSKIMDSDDINLLLVVEKKLGIRLKFIRILFR